MMVVFIMEDTTSGVHAQRDWETPGGIAPIAECMFMGQKLDLGVVCVTHTLSGTSPIIRQNVGTFVVCGLPGENPRLICDTLMVTPAQAEKIKTLHPGEFVILNPALGDKCVYATFEEPQMPGRISESEQKKVAARFLGQVKACPPAPLSVFFPKPSSEEGYAQHSRGSDKALSSDQVEMLVGIATGPRRPMCQIYDQMNKSRAQGRRVVKRLESIGAVVLHTIASGRRGGQLLFPEVTDYGWRVLADMRIVRPTPKTGGGFTHELAAALIQRAEARKSRKLAFEIDIGGRRLDVRSTDPVTGEATLFNIGVSDPAREAANIEAILKLPVMQTSKFVFVAKDKEFTQQVRRLLSGQTASKDLLPRVDFKTIADFAGTQ
jgi:hypothetical protein